MRRLLLILIFILLLYNISAECNSTQININSASAEELVKIINIGTKIAVRVIDARPFSSVGDLARVKGIGNNTNLAEIKAEGLACVNEETQNTSEENHSEDESEDEEETNPVTSESADNSEEKNIGTSDNLSKKSTEITPISLNAKTIKSEDNKENLKEDLALYGIIAFCSVFGALLLLKKRKYKNEFQ